MTSYSLAKKLKHSMHFFFSFQEIGTFLALFVFHMLSEVNAQELEKLTYVKIGEIFLLSKLSTSLMCMKPTLENISDSLIC